MKILGLFIVVLLLQNSLSSSSIEFGQVGTVSSGRSVSGDNRLEFVVGQPIAGSSGLLTSGFFATQQLPNYLAGDANDDGIVSISDAVFLINYIFAGGPAPNRTESGDADCNHIVTISDPVYLINFIFAGGPSPQYCY